MELSPGSNPHGHLLWTWYLFCSGVLFNILGMYSRNLRLLTQVGGKRLYPPLALSQIQSISSMPPLCLLAGSLHTSELHSIPYSSKLHGSEVIPGERSTPEALGHSKQSSIIAVKLWCTSPSLCFPPALLCFCPAWAESAPGHVAIYTSSIENLI